MSESLFNKPELTPEERFVNFVEAHMPDQYLRPDDNSVEWAIDDPSQIIPIERAVFSKCTFQGEAEVDSYSIILVAENHSSARIEQELCETVDVYQVTYSKAQGWFVDIESQLYSTDAKTGDRLIDMLARQEESGNMTLIPADQ